MRKRVGLSILVVATAFMALSSPFVRTASSQEDEKVSRTLRIMWDKETYVEWDRKEALKLSLEQGNSIIRYFFTLAAVNMGVLLRLLTGPYLAAKADSVKKFTKCVNFCWWTGVVFLIMSYVPGYLAYSSVTTMFWKDEFNFSGLYSGGAFAQLILLALGFVFTVAGMILARGDG